jgi:hypothetical protein
LHPLIAKAARPYILILKVNGRVGKSLKVDNFTLAAAIAYNRECSLALSSHPWSFYHLARDEQINRNKEIA